MMPDKVKSIVEVVLCLGNKLESAGLLVVFKEVPFARGLASVLLGLSMEELTELRRLSMQSEFVNEMTTGTAQRALESISRMSEESWTLFLETRRSIEGPRGSQFPELVDTPAHAMLLSTVAMALRADRDQVSSSQGLREDEITSEAREYAARTDLIYENFAFYWGKAASQFDTIDKLAKKAGVSTVTIHALDKRRAKPQMRTLVKIARALGVGIEQLMQPRKS